MNKEDFEKSTAPDQIKGRRLPNISVQFQLSLYRFA